MRFAPSDKIHFHREFLNYMDGRKVMPINVEISVSGRCNASCRECFYMGRQSGQILPYEDVIRLLYEMKGAKVKAITWTGGGEPTLHPDFGKIVGEANRYGFRQGLFTNGTRLNYNPSVFDWIRVSITEILNEETLKKIRERAKVLGLNVNYYGQNLESILELADRIKADYVSVRPALNLGEVKTEIEPPKITHNKLIIQDYKFEEARKGGKPEERGYSFCEAYHFVPFVWEDGRIDACAYHRFDDRFNLGHIREGFVNVMMRAKEKLPVIRCQTCCKNHELNKVISQARKLEDIDFV